jgi:hypothetical protein
MKIERLKKMFTACNLTMEKRKRLAHIFLLGFWAVIQYSLGNGLFGLFIVALLIITLIMPRPPYFAIIAATVLIIALFYTPTIDTWTVLKKSNLSTFQTPKLFLRNIFTANSGQEVLPVYVQQMLPLLQTHHVTSYQLSDQLSQDPLIKQRVIEAAWPIKMDRKSAYILILLKQINNNPACVVIDQREDVALEYCH